MPDNVEPEKKPETIAQKGEELIRKKAERIVQEAK